MATYSNNWIDELKNSVNIVQVIEQYLPLTKKGNRYSALCPFHPEKTPSFTVDEEHQYYKCFGCGRAGDVIEFVKEKEKLEFLDAVEFIANKFNIKIPEKQESAEITARKRDLENIYDANLIAARFYRDNLQKPAAKTALEYMYNRGFSDEVIAAFGVGCSLDYESLYNHLISKGIKEEVILKAALVNENKKGDFQAKRLVIPIIDAKDKVIGFSGRSLTSDMKPKYKNSRETLAFIKNQTLYNMNTIRHLRKEEDVKYLILVEGYMDVMALYEVGIKNVIASMGTSLTQNQCVAISKVVKQVYVCFDGDAAGQDATLRSLDLLSAEDVDVRVISIPDKMDPDDYVKNYGASSFEQLLIKAEPVTQFKIRKLKDSLDFSTIEGKPKFVKETIPILVKLDSITQSTYIDYVSQLSGISKDIIINAISESQDNNPVKINKDIFISKRKKSVSDFDVDRGRLVIAAWLFAQFDLSIDEFISADMFKIEEQKIIAGRFLEEYRNNNRVIFKEIWPNEIEADEIRNELNKIYDKKDDWQNAYGIDTYNDAIRSLMLDYLQNLSDLLVGKIIETDNDEERNLYKEKLTKVLEYKTSRGL